jgi:hypothetical protein
VQGKEYAVSNFAVTIGQLLVFDLAISSIHNGMLSVSSFAYVRLVAGIMIFIGNFFPVVAVRRSARPLQ